MRGAPGAEGTRIPRECGRAPRAAEGHALPVLARFLGFDDFFLREYGGAEAMPTAEQVSVAARTSVNLFTSEDASRRRHNSVCVDVVSVCSGIGSQPRSQRATWVNP